MSYIANIGWVNHEFDTIQAALNAFLADPIICEYLSMGLKPLWKRKDTDDSTAKPFNVDEIKAELEKGDYVTLITRGDDGSAGGCASLWPKDAHTAYEKEARESLQEFVNQSGYTVVLGGEVFKAKK